VVKAKAAPYLARGTPACRNPMVNDSDYDIVGRFGAEYRGIVQYYLLAGDVFRLHRLRWAMETSMLRTLAGKHRSSAAKMAARYKTVIDTPRGKRTCFEARVQREGRKPLVTRFGGIPLTRQRKAVLTDRQPVPAPGRRKGKELICRLRAGRCEWCKRRAEVQVHHVRVLADLATPGRPQPEWSQIMARMRRKTLVVCPPCHDKIHDRHPVTAPTE
jgi:hypothetical protein